MSNSRAVDPFTKGGKKGCARRGCILQIQTLYYHFKAVYATDVNRPSIKQVSFRTLQNTLALKLIKCIIALLLVFQQAT